MYVGSRIYGGKSRGQEMMNGSVIDSGIDYNYKLLTPGCLSINKTFMRSCQCTSNDLYVGVCQCVMWSVSCGMCQLTAIPFDCSPFIFFPPGLLGREGGGRCGKGRCSLKYQDTLACHEFLRVFMMSILYTRRFRHCPSCYNTHTIYSGSLYGSK